MATPTEYKSTSVTAGPWETLIVDGRETGEVHWLRGEGEPAPTAGLWRIGVDDFPYNVHGSDTFHVIEGEAELETPDGEKIMLVPGGLYSFPDGFTATWRTRSPFVKFFVIA